MLFTLKTAALLGIDAVPVEVEVDVPKGGLPGFHLVGLPMGAVRESTVRIKSAIDHSGYDLGHVRITVNLAPADLRKEGAGYDLPIALGSLIARGRIACRRSDLLIIGELSLDGRVRPIRGALLFAEAAQKQQLKGIILPRENAGEASYVEGISVYGVDSLTQAIRVIEGDEIEPHASMTPHSHGQRNHEQSDFSDVTGQPEARLAAEIAAAGGHNFMLVGAPGSGKTMIARRIGSILPEMSRAEMLETTRVHSVVGLTEERGIVLKRPFRAPHHTASCIGLIGGGPNPRPGEVSLAHNGVLFLDELPEFQRQTLEALRQPIEDGRVTIVRARHVLSFPSRVMLVAAMNPCPCGYRGSSLRTCTCGEQEARRYAHRISGPLLDRFDLFVQVQPVPVSSLLLRQCGEDSARIAARVCDARERQLRRYRDTQVVCNAQMSHRELIRHVVLDDKTQEGMTRYAGTYRLSARALHRACRVARTIADLNAHDRVRYDDVMLALTLQQGRWLHALSAS